MSDTPDEDREPLPVNPGRRAGGRDARTREPGRPASRAEPTDRTSQGSARRRIGIRELRQHASVYVDLAEKGYTVDGVLEPAEEPGGVGDIDPYPSPASGRLAASRLLGQAGEGQAPPEEAPREQAPREQAEAEERR